VPVPVTTAPIAVSPASSPVTPRRVPPRQKPPPPFAVQPVQTAAQGGRNAPGSALEASNAAAAAAKGAPDPNASAAATASPAAEARPEGKLALDLVWFDARVLPRARKHKAWRPLLDALREKAPDPDIDDPALHPDPAAGEERREIFEILAHGEALGVDGLRAAVQAAVRDDGRFVAPLVLLAGEIALPFDEVEALRALSGAMGPFTGNDEALRGALDAAKELLSARDLPSSQALADTLAARLREAYGKRTRALALAQIEAQVERALLDRRHHQERAVFGARHVRALWQPPDPAPARAEAAPPRPAPPPPVKSGIPTYLPDALAQVMPLFPRLSVRLVAEAHLAVDLHEAHPLALRVLALARSAPVPVF
jgi:hypothetical protein